MPIIRGIIRSLTRIQIGLEAVSAGKMTETSDEMTILRIIVTKIKLVPQRG